MTKVESRILEIVSESPTGSAIDLVIARLVNEGISVDDARLRVRWLLKCHRLWLNPDMRLEVVAKEPCASTSGQVVIDYTNWKGERSTRTIIPIGLRFGASEWHADEQWLLEAHDVERGVTRTFAMVSIHSWRSG
jgi:hypothetical protein